MGLLPTRKRKIVGHDLDGRPLQLVFTVAHKLYTCPSCRSSIEIGAEHVLVRRREDSGRRFHQHWHRDCAAALAREISIAASLARDGRD